MTDNGPGGICVPGTGCPNPATLGAHIYDTDDPTASYVQVMIIPTCAKHNSSVGNEGRYWMSEKVIYLNKLVLF